MTNNRKLIGIKTLHTLIWIFYNLVIGYMLYAVITNNMDNRFWLGYIAVIAEGVILLLFKWTCPLTILARRYTDEQNDNFDIYLPIWLAKQTKNIYTGLFLVVVLLTIYRMIS